jgi:predicted PurR-regulated permease PerM
VLFLTIFLLYEDDSFKRKLVAQIESRNSKRITVRILNDIAAQIQRFIWVQASTSVAVAIVTWLALWWLGIAEPMVWGVLAGVLNVVPYFGPLIVTAGLAIVGYLQFGTFAMAGLVAGVALAITTVEGMFLTPIS